jgi:DNA-directed RNA polymerase delta subunit
MFNYEKLTQDLFNELPTRKRQVLEKRFGIEGGVPLTLQAIGDEIGITRERVRQIENDALAYIKESQTQKLQKPFEYFVDHLTNNGGLREENVLLQELGQDKFQNHVLLLLTIGDPFFKVKESTDLLPFWTVKPQIEAEAKNILKTIIKEFKNSKSPLPVKDLGEKIPFNLEIPVLVSFIDVSKFIFESPFGDYGMVDWPEIRPRGLKDQAYLVLKRNEKPMHFKDIAKGIEELPFVDRKILPESVHNELIRNNKFVLIGRGLYALTEWGYQPGTVKDIIKDLLKKNKSGLAKEEIITKVLTQRNVKESTIVLNLQDKKTFNRDDGVYTLR